MSYCEARDPLRRAFLLAVLSLLLLCHPSPSHPPPQVEYSGCWAVYVPGPVCARYPDTPKKPVVPLRLWVKVDPGSEVEIWANCQRLKDAGKASMDGRGRRFKLFLPLGVSSLKVRLLRQDGTPSSDWSLALAPPEKPAWLVKFEELVHGGKMAEARRLLNRLNTTVPRRERGLLLKKLADVAHLDGNHEQEESFLQHGILADRSERRWSGEVEKATQLANLYIAQGRLTSARQILLKRQSLTEEPADAKYLVAYNRGLLAVEVGDYSTALKELGKAAELAERVGMATPLWESEQVLARVLQDLGRSEDASVRFAKLWAGPPPKQPCDRGIFLTNWGWSRLHAREAGEEPEDPAPLLKEAKAEFDRNQCTPDQRLNARLNLALTYQQSKQWSEARQELDEARLIVVKPNLLARLWWDDLDAREVIAEGNPEHAIDLYEELEHKAERSSSAEGRLRARLGRAKALIALHRLSAAIEAFEVADRWIDDQSWQIPAHEGRDTFIAQREEATRRYLKLLLDTKQRKPAFILARRGRSRLLRQLAVQDRLSQLTDAEKETWVGLLSRYEKQREMADRQAAEEGELPGDELKRLRQDQARRLAETRDTFNSALASLGAPGNLQEKDLSPPVPGEVVLAYHPLPDRSWAGFAATVRGVHFSTFKLPAEMLEHPREHPGELSRILLVPFQPDIAASRRVRVLAYGRLRSVDFHALPFAGEPLLARHLVLYSLDLPVRSSPAPASARRVALIVSNPQGNLPAASDEAVEVAKAVNRWSPGWSLKRLNGQQARAKEVLAALPMTRLFHYAGHGIFAGFGGWDSSLPLAKDSQLRLGEVLALHPAPPWVVLSSCEAAQSSEQAPGEGIGLANAFLLAGSQVVVAATRRVDDHHARDLMRELYQGWQPGMDLPAQLQRAQLAYRRQHPSGSEDWASFRILVP